tara:strand:- start:119 stop:505 length:387 start_codon:yes stop_codon:yes gene_type:complete
MSKIYNKHIDRAVRTIDSVQPTFGQEKTEKFKKKLKIKKLEKELGKTPVKNYYVPKDFNKGGRVGLKGGGGLGAQSVKYGLDDNYGVTAADPKAKFIAAAKNKKKKLKKFDSPMAKAIKKKDKKKVIV